MADPQPVQVTVNNHRPPIFHGKEGEDPDLHWILFEDYVDDNTIAAAQQVTKFRSTLQSDARLWYRTN